MGISEAGASYTKIRLVWVGISEAGASYTKNQFALQKEIRLWSWLGLQFFVPTFYALIEMGQWPVELSALQFACQDIKL
jgi:hypothetical protein